MRREHFIGLGFMKCGTTYLSGRLTYHPELYVPPVRELHFWNNFFAGSPMPDQKRYAYNYIERIKRNLDDGKSIADHLRRFNYWSMYSKITTDSVDSYWKLFKPGLQKQMTGEICPSYVEITPENLVRMADLIPRARVFLVMREPLSRLISHFNHVARLRPETMESDDAVLQWLDQTRTRAQIEYGEALAATVAAFGHGRVRHFFFEDVIRDEFKFFDALLRFVGVPDGAARLPLGSREQRLAAKRPMSDRLMRAFEDRVAHVPGAVERIIGPVPPEWRRS